MPGLLERDAELAALGELVAGAAAARGRLVLIEDRRGSASRACCRACATGRPGSSGCWPPARASSSASSPTASSASCSRRTWPRGPRRCSAGSAAPAAAVFAGLEGEGGASFAALHGLYWLALNLAAERPLLLAVDDLHWCDRPSLRFLAYLARRLDGAPILVAATLRSNEPPTDPALVGEIVHDPATLPLRPGPLSAGAVRALVRDRLGAEADEPFCAACHEATGVAAPPVVGDLKTIAHGWHETHGIHGFRTEDSPLPRNPPPSMPLLTFAEPAARATRQKAEGRTAQPRARASAPRGSAGSWTGAVCSARSRISRQDTPSLTSAGMPSTTAVATSTACRMIP